MVAGLHVHVLPGVVAADDGRGRTAGCGHSHRVVDAVSYQGAVSGGAGHRAGAGPAGERLGDVELVEVKSEEDHVWVCSADLVNALKKKTKIFEISIFGPFPVPR